MQRKCCPQQCQSTLESSRNRYWEQEVNVSSWLRSSQQKLRRENKSSLTAPRNLCFLQQHVHLKRACMVFHQSEWRICLTDWVCEAFKHIITTFFFSLFRGKHKKPVSISVKWSLQCQQSWTQHDCFTNVRTTRLTTLSTSRKLSKQRNQTKLHETVSCGFPFFNRWKMTDSWSLRGSKACFSLFCVQAHRSCQRWHGLLMLSVLDRGQRWCFGHAEAKLRWEGFSLNSFITAVIIYNQYVSQNLFSGTGNPINDPDPAAHTSRVS